MTPNETTLLKVLKWALDSNTGASSKAIAMHMVGIGEVRGSKSYPHDGGDFDRCLRLLDAVPEWRERMPEMASKSPAWAALVAAWDELTEMSRANSPNIYKRIQEILATPEAADPNSIKIAPSVSLRTGPAQ